MNGVRTRKRPHEPRKRPKQERARATVDAIVEAASQVFEQRGYDEATTELVAERAGVSIGTLYQYFPGKDALLVALFERHLDEIEGHFDALDALLAARAPLDDVARAMVSRLFAMHQSAPRVHRIFFEEAPVPGRLLERWHALEARMKSAWSSYLRERARDPELAALMTMSLVEAMAHRYTLYPPPLARSPEQLEEATVAMMVAYLERERA